MELFSFVLKLTTVASYLDLKEANINLVTGTNILNARGLKHIYHWREVNAADFVEERYRRPRWSSGLGMIVEDADGIRGSRLLWNR